MYRVNLPVKGQSKTLFAQATINGDTLALQFPLGTSPCLQRHLKKKLTDLYKKRCASFGIIFECWRDRGMLHIQLKQKRTINTCLVERDSVSGVKSFQMK